MSSKQVLGVDNASCQSIKQIMICNILKFSEIRVSREMTNICYKLFQKALQYFKLTAIHLWHFFKFQISIIIPKKTYMSQEIPSDQNQEPNLKPLLLHSKHDKSQVTVICRVKPLIASQSQIQMIIDKDNAEIQISQPRQETKKTFSFNRIYTDETQQQFVKECCRPILKSVLDEKKGYLIFSYGVTNSGKTHTILGTQKQPGILPYLVTSLSQRNQVHISAIQLYNDEFFSLSNRKKIIPKEIGGFLDFRECNISEIINPENMEEKIKQYISNRTHNDTKINKKSSRSHALFRIDVNDVAIGVVDLAGSQRTNRIIADIDETLNINKSLLCLGRCIKALNENKQTPIPYRESKLTRVLIEYFAGRVNVLMIANISQAQDHFHENMKVLDYAIMAKDIRHCSTINSLMKSKSKKKVSKIDIFEALSKSTKREVKAGQKSLKSSRKIFGGSLNETELENLRQQNEKYVKLIRKLQLEQNLRRLQGSLETYNYFSNIMDAEAQKSNEQKMIEIKTYSYESPIKPTKQYCDVAVGTSANFNSKSSLQEIHKIEEELRRMKDEEKAVQMVNQQTYITSSFKKSMNSSECLKTPNKKIEFMESCPSEGENFIKKSCKLIYQSAKKILKGGLEATSLKKMSAKKIKMEISEKKNENKLNICSNTYFLVFEPENFQEDKQNRNEFSFGETKIQTSEIGTQVDLIILREQQKVFQDQITQKNDQTQIGSEEEGDNLEVCQKVTTIQIRNSAVIEQNLQEKEDDETVGQLEVETEQKQYKITEAPKNEKKNKTKKTRAKRDVERVARVAETRKIAAQLFRQNARTPLKKRLRNRQKKLVYH